MYCSGNPHRPVCSGNSTNSVFDFHREKRSYDIVVVVAVCSKEAEKRLQATRKIRDQIKAKIEEFIGEKRYHTALG